MAEAQTSSPIVDQARFEEALARFDAANAEDPNMEMVDGELVPKELIYGRRMTAWLNKFRPDAPEVVQLAARAQHIRRWTVPRSDYPMDRNGYKRWRSGLYKFHAETAADILAEVGYEPEVIDRVKILLQKKQLKRDPDVQLLEDVICLVFMDHYFADFAKKHDEAKLIGIVQKTWRKMSLDGHEAALTLDFPPDLGQLVGKALSDV